MLELGQQFHLHILKKINKAKEIHIKNVLSTRARMCIVLCAIRRIKCSILVLDPFTRLWVIWKASHQRRFWIGTEKQKYKLACPHICIMKGNVLNRKIYALLNYQKHTRIVWTLYLSGSQFWNLLSFFGFFKFITESPSSPFICWRKMMLHCGGNFLFFESWFLCFLQITTDNSWEKLQVSVLFHITYISIFFNQNV